MYFLPLHRTVGATVDTAAATVPTVANFDAAFVSIVPEYTVVELQIAQQDLKSVVRDLPQLVQGL